MCCGGHDTIISQRRALGTGLSPLSWRDGPPLPCVDCAGLAPGSLVKVVNYLQITVPPIDAQAAQGGDYVWDGRLNNTDFGQCTFDVPNLGGGHSPTLAGVRVGMQNSQLLPIVDTLGKNKWALVLDYFNGAVNLNWNVWMKDRYAALNCSDYVGLYSLDVELTSGYSAPHGSFTGPPGVIQIVKV